MPWNPLDADRHKKGLNETQQKRWAAIANSVLKKGKDEASAIRQANSSVGNPGKFATVAKRRLKEKLGQGGK